MATTRRLTTELAHAQRRLQQAEAERQRAERRFRIVFNQQFQGRVILSPQGRVLEFSQQLRLDRGSVPPEQVIGKLFWDTVCGRIRPRCARTGPSG